MPRTPKCRRVAFMPEVTYFKPAGIRLRDLEDVQLSLEEVEALRLKELEGLEQEQAAKKMNVSRPTFQRILSSAKYKTADALLNGKAIRIEGGNFEMALRYFRCNNNHEWCLPLASDIEGLACPTCLSADISEITPAARNGEMKCGLRHQKRHRA